jgi:ATP-binding cassette subfamily F protein 3
VFISHDVYFIRALAIHVVHVNAGRLTHYPGGYQYYLDKTKAESERAGLTATGKDTFHRGSGQNKKGRDAVESFPGTSKKDQKRLEAEQRQARSRRRKSQQQIVHRLEKEIQELEGRQKEMVDELEKAETYEKPGRAQEINRDLVDVQHRLAELNPEWEQEATRLAALD